MTNKKPRLAKIKPLVDNLCLVNEKDLWAVGSKVAKEEFGEEKLRESLADLEWVKRKATLHESIIEGVMKGACVVPFKFATLFASEGNLRAMLNEQAEILKETLEALEGKEEWGVKIYCDLRKLRAQLFMENEALLKMDLEIGSSSPGRGFFLKKKKEELLIAEIGKEINECGRASFRSLNERSLHSRINRLLPKEVTEREEDLILNSAFLLDKKKAADFFHAVENLRARYGNKGFLFDCSGPWPPFNFCQSSLQAKRSSEG